MHILFLDGFMFKIVDVRSWWVLDSRANPTVRCEVTVDVDGKSCVGHGLVPSGASTGSYEAVELRDGGSEFHGKGVRRAMDNIDSKIKPEVINKEFKSPKEVDELMIKLDKTENKSNLGANAILGVSMAVHRALAKSQKIEDWEYLRSVYFPEQKDSNSFPRLMVNVLNGGEHADNDLAIQEFMVVPKTGELVSDVQVASEVYHTLKKNLKSKNMSTALGDEGGFAPKLNTTAEALDELVLATADHDCDFALDCAANEFYSDQIYKIDNDQKTGMELIEYYKELIQKYPMVSIEDPFTEDDVLNWQIFTQAVGEGVQIVGDDLFVTNKKRFYDIGVKQKAGNAILIKMNQIGSVSETCEVISYARSKNFNIIISHRSGETEDVYLADLAYACQSEFIKTGAPARGERTAKYNRLIEISQKM